MVSSSGSSNSSNFEARLQNWLVALSQETIDLWTVPNIIWEIIWNNIHIDQDRKSLERIATDFFWKNGGEVLVSKRVNRALQHDNIPGEVITDKYWLVSRHVVAQELMK